MKNREGIISAWKKHIFRVAGSTLIGAALWMPVIPGQAYEGDYTSSFTFSEDGIAVQGEESGYKISGTELTIQSPGTYLITGNCSEGSIRIKKETTGVTLILSDLNLKSTETSPLVIAKSAEAKIIINGNNVLTDAEDAANEDSADEAVADAFEGAAIKIKSGAVVTFAGDGTLTADGSDCKNGIKGGAQSEIILGESTSDSFTLKANAANNALAGDGMVTINGGTIRLTADGDGLKASPDEDDTESLGEIWIRGGTIVIDSAEDGIQASGDFTMENGNLTITSGGGVSGASALDEDTSAKGIKSDTSITVQGGTIDLNCADDAIHLNGSAGDETISLTGGDLTIRSGDDGVHSDYYLNIGSKTGEEGPQIVIADSYEGLEAAVVYMYSGDVSVTSSDDGVNAANSDLNGYSFSLNVQGGYLYVNADGDGLDSNGSLYLTGGTAEIYGSSNGDNAPLDYERPGTFSVDGATVLAVGNSGMAENPSEGCYVTFGASSGMGGGSGGMNMPGGAGNPGRNSGSTFSITKGTRIEIRDSSGNLLYTGEGVKSANYVLFASTGLTAGESYSLYLNGSSVATASASGSSEQDPGDPGREEPSDPAVQEDSISAFVERMYVTCLGRESDMDGKTYWVNELKNGSMTGAQLAEEFVFSAESNRKNLSEAEFVTMLYNVMMDREPDTAGQNYWVEKLSSGTMTRYEVANGFITSAEFSEICATYGIVRGSLDVAAVAPVERFVIRMYEKSLERTAEQEGVYYWTFRLRDHVENGATFAEKVFFSEEMESRGLINDKFVELLYNAMMDRSSDEEGKTYWLNNMADGMSKKDVLNGFINSPEFTGICAVYGIERGSL